MKNKRIISIVLSVLLVIAIIPTGIFVASASTSSGSCGDNLMWQYDFETDTLTIFGVGPMNNYFYTSYNGTTDLTTFVTTAPWRSYRNIMKTVIIESGVNSIGNCSFRGCYCLKDVTIPDSVTSIGWGAFYGTAWYDNQPDGLVYAGKVAYMYKGTCPSNVIIEDGTLGIAGSAFYCCTNLTSVTIPDSVTTIGNSAFYGCNGLKTAGEIGGNYDFEFGWKDTIPDHAFYNCSWLTSINIPVSVTIIGDSAFYGCDGLTSVIYYETENKWNNILIGNGNAPLESAKRYTFISCGDDCSFIVTGNTISIRGSGKTNSYKTSGSVPWYDYANLVNNIVVNEGITALGNYAFNCFINLDSVIIKNKDITFGKYVFNTDADMTVFAQSGGNIEEYCNNNGIDFIDISMSAPTPKLVSYTSSNIILVQNKLLEYSINNINWQKSNTFEGLSPATEYNIYARYIPTVDINDTVSEPLIVKTAKAKITAPPKPVCIKNTDTEITLKANPDYEYSIDGDDWQKSNVFLGLIHGNTYSLYQRLAETETEFASPASEPLVMQLVKKTASAPTAPDYQSHTDNSITLAPNDLYEFSIDGENWQRSNMFAGLSKNVIYSFYQRVAETETEYASESSAALIIAIPDNPEILEAGYENILVKLVDGFEYCLDDMVWQDSNSFDMLIDNTEYYVHQRLKAVDDEKVYQITSDYTTIITDNTIMHVHTISDWQYDDQRHWNTCVNCGKMMDVAEHISGDWIIDVQPTTESFGRKHMGCSVCGCVLAEQEILKIPRYTPGDINDDGEVNNKDLTRLFQYLSDWDVKVNEYALDINGDNAINNKDLTRLFQFLSDWDVEISVKNVYEMIPSNYENSKTGFLWPVAGYYGVSRPFGNSNGSSHVGIDISGTGIVGQPIFAIADGVVYQANKSWTPESGTNGNKSYGNYCAINHGNITINGSSAKYVAFYAHATSIIVSVGETVKKGQIIGYVGSTGNATSPHLHIGIQKNGNWVNPYVLLWE